MFRAELVKLKRSAVWVIAPILPLMAVITGTMNTANNPDALTGGWMSLTSQIVLFYGLLFYSIGIALLSAAIWRTEHRGTNWNLLLTTTQHPLRLVLAKIGATVIPVAFMQLVLVTGTLTAGALFMRLDGPIPWEFAVVGAISVIAAIPLITLQSLLSMLIRSFATPVALCLLGCVVGVATITKDGLRPLSYLIPQALNTNALNLGSNALASAGALSLDSIAPLAAAAALLTAIFAATTLWSIHTIRLR